MKKMSDKTDYKFAPGLPLRSLEGIGPKKEALFAKLGIYAVEDMLEFYPRAYEDRREIRKVSSLAGIESGSKVMLRLRVLTKLLGRGFGRKRTLRLLAEDDSGRMEIIFFNSGFLASSFTPGKEYCFFGPVDVSRGRMVMTHPSFSEAGSEESGILPTYRLTAGLTQKDMRRAVRRALELAHEMPETLPDSVIEAEKLCSKPFAYANIHYPVEERDFRAARYRLIFEEFFYLRLALVMSKERFGLGRAGVSFKGDGGDRFIASLPYELTSAQKRVWKEIRSDMRSATSMNRLLQGDVGCGKTAIAEASLAQAVSAGYQGAFMAPTEILAQQHFQTLSEDFAAFGFKIVLLTGSVSAAERRGALASIASGEADIVIGTHAMLSEAAQFSNLGLVITDEQHRFGVGQRKTLAQKGLSPDVLVMTATPIPRTLAVVLYGDLDISVIDELPPGRRAVDTRQYDEASRASAYELLIREVRAGRQAYIVAPLIEDSENLDSRSAEGIFEEFRRDYPDIPCDLLHGNLKQEEKNRIMQEFYEGKLKVLVSTVVIEVGINVPNAGVMLIENSERFGLAQLHQLRGRVGRGTADSYCLLLLDDDKGVAKERADMLCSSNDGLLIAEKDLELRGPGELFGFRQHGLPQLQLADPVRHVKAAEQAGRAIERLLESDPLLAAPQNSSLAERVDDKFLNSRMLVL